MRESEIYTGINGGDGTFKFVKIRNTAVALMVQRGNNASTCGWDVEEQKRTRDRAEQDKIAAEMAALYNVEIRDTRELD